MDIKPETWVCRVCGSTEVQVCVRAWFDPNEPIDRDAFIEADWEGNRYYWCAACGCDTYLVHKEDFVDA